MGMGENSSGGLQKFKKNASIVALVGLAGLTGFGLLQSAQRNRPQESTQSQPSSYVPTTPEQKEMFERYKLLVRSRGVEELSSALRRTEHEPESSLPDRIERFVEDMMIVKEAQREALSKSRRHPGDSAMALEGVSADAVADSIGVVAHSPTGGFAEGFLALVGLITTGKFAYKKLAGFIKHVSSL